ncbi:bifunctional phosphoglucose/phosphomannose isomerase [Desulfurococcus amylolyticus DSM 16532]|uniref:Bifunctional phosphoglucose/phosphomannose isomerase n=2 Tax=Desulfurococcus amylolyticus TaxID=94694 RepID=I3XSS6_DESAM|nr:bifunctional phosphoglucose/phosphomannose isomerase [Desulfurococcus amylolyticus DSM 16532]
MEEMYRGWVNQIREALLEWGRYRVSGVFDKIVVLGMGGSGIVGDFLATLSQTSKGLPVYTSKSHHAPGFIDSETLVLSVSYSGNTVETVNATIEAFKKTGNIVVVSSGGHLRDYALKHGLPYIPLPTGLAPRASLPSMLFKILGLLDSSGLSMVGRRDAEETLSFINSVMDNVVEEAYRLAEWIHGIQGLLVIATHTPLEALALRGKNEFNENSKIPVKIDVAPEWMHNDIVGYEEPSGISGIPLKIIEIFDPVDEVGCRLVEFMDEIYKGVNAWRHRLSLRGETLLDKLIYGSLVLGVASVKLAVLRGIDPLETRSIKRYKESVHNIFPGL